MTKYAAILTTILLFFSCTNKSRDFTVMTWNIWHGGTHGSKADNYKQDSSNTIHILNVIKRENPDILFMQETYCCGMQIAKTAGFKYSWRGSSNLSIHSKNPIVDTLRIFKPFNSHGVRIRLDERDIVCFNIWLHYLPDYFNSADSLTAEELIEAEKPTRYAEIVAILDEIKAHTVNSNSVPVIIGGDFNSGSHLDWIESTRDLHYGKVVTWPVSLAMARHGFTDSFRKIHPDPLKMPGATWGGIFFDTDLSDRIDYLYYIGKKLQVVDSRVIKEDPPGGFFNSDHRGVLTTFLLNLQD
jgi:exonuclease III